MALYGWGKVGVRVEDRYVRVYYPTFPHHLPETLLTRCRGGCPHPPSRREARNIGEDGRFVQPTFSQTAAQGRAGTPAPTTRLGRVRNICRRAYTYRHTRYDARWSIKYLRFPLSHGRVVEDADPYGWVRDGRFSNHMTPPQEATRGASGTPPLTGWFLTFPDRSHPLGSIRPRYEKD